MNGTTKSQLKIGLAILLMAVIVGLVNECEAQTEPVNYDSVLAVNFDPAYIKLGVTEKQFRGWVHSMNRFPGQLHDNYGDTSDWKFRYVFTDKRNHLFQYYFKNGKIGYIIIDDEDNSQLNSSNFLAYKKSLETIYTLESVTPKTNPTRHIYKFVANDKSHQLLVIDKNGKYTKQVNALPHFAEPESLMKKVSPGYSNKERSTSTHSQDTYTTPRTKADERVYYTGSRGGCYYYSGSGKKVYVDHSYCR